MESKTKLVTVVPSVHVQEWNLQEGQERVKCLFTAHVHESLNSMLIIGECCTHAGSFSAGLKQGLRFCLCDKLPGGAQAVDL